MSAGARDLMLPTCRFAQFELQPRERRLLSTGEPVALGARAFDVLLALAGRHGELVTKSELLEAVWPDAVVEENNLQVHVSALRKVLGHEVIATIPGRGYRFIGQLQPVATAVPAALAREDGVPTVGNGSPAGASVVPPASMARPSIAVLPFANPGAEPDQAFFADGLAEGIIARLARSKWLFVIARNSSFSFRDAELDVRQVSRQLGVRYLVSGSVRRAANRLRATAQLSDVIGGEQLWSEQYDRDIADLFALEDDIASAVASAVEPVFLRREQDVAARAEVPSLAHWELLMRGRWHFWRSTPADNQRARGLATQALALRPDDVATLSLLAFTHLVDLWTGNTDDARHLVGTILKLALAAVRSDDRDSLARYTLGTALSCAGDMPAAIAELRHAVALYPDFAGASGELARLLAFSGGRDEALEMVVRCIECSPADPHLSLWIRSQSIAHFTAGEDRDALRCAIDAVARRPDWFFNHYLLAALAQVAGEPAQAATALAEAKRQMPRYTEKTLRVGHPFTQRAHHDRFVGALRAAGWDS